MIKKIWPFITALILGMFSVSPAYAASYMQGNAKWDSVARAAYYHVYYREAGQANYSYSALNIPATSNSINIQYLKPGVRYWYNVVAFNSSDQEISWSGLKKLRVNWMR